MTDSIIAVVTANIDVDGFTVRLPCFGTLEVRHRQGRVSNSSLTGKIQMTAGKRKVRFIPLARLSELEHGVSETVSFREFLLEVSALHHSQGRRAPL